MPEKPLTAIIVGAGHRGLTYASYAEQHPDELKIVGVADLIELRRKTTAARFGFSQEMCFETAEELAARGLLADCIINGTMDHQHVPTSLPLLDAGYDILLEKPFATGAEEMWTLVEAARRNNRKVMICHVLRYAPFYVAVRERVASGLIGEIVNLQTVEHVSYHHMAVGFVRGKWNNRDRCRTSMLLAKCCHDLDLIAWMKSGVAPTAVSSFGSNMQFRPEKAPVGSGTRCLVDCDIEPECQYSAKKHYIDHPDRWSFYVWDCLERFTIRHIDPRPGREYSEEVSICTRPATCTALLVAMQAATCAWWLISSASYAASRSRSAARESRIPSTDTCWPMALTGRWKSGVSWKLPGSDARRSSPPEASQGENAHGSGERIRLSRLRQRIAGGSASEVGQDSEPASLS